MKNDSLKRGLLTAMVICLALLAIVAVIAIAFGGDFVKTLFVSKDEKITQAIDVEWQSSIKEEQPAFLDAIDEKSEYTIGKIKNEGSGYYSVEVEVNSPDMSEGLNAYASQTQGKQLSEEEMNAELVSIIQSSPMKTSQHKLSVIEDSDGKFHVSFPVEFIDAMFGYIYVDSLESLNESLSGLAQEE